MDELELRIAALELLALERLALDEPGRLAQMEANIREGLDTPVDDDERTVRLQALQLIEDARQRFDLFTAGVRFPKA